MNSKGADEVIKAFDQAHLQLMTFEAVVRKHCTALEFQAIRREFERLTLILNDNLYPCFEFESPDFTTARRVTRKRRHKLRRT